MSMYNEGEIFFMRKVALAVLLLICIQHLLTGCNIIQTNSQIGEVDKISKMQQKLDNISNEQQNLKKEIEKLNIQIENNTKELLRQTEYFTNKKYIVGTRVFGKGSKVLTIDNITIILKSDNNILVETENNKIEIKNRYNADENDEVTLKYAEISNDSQFLAFTVEAHASEKIYLVNLKLSEYNLISDMEIVSKPRWSPKENTLALSIGSIGKEKLGIYYPDIKEIYTVNENFISIIDIKWSKSGEFIDFIAEKTSDKFSKIGRAHV